MKRTISNNCKKRVWECKYFEFDYDDLGKWRFCHNMKSGFNECQCKSIFQKQVCPFFKKTGRASIIEMDDNDKKLVDEFKEKLRIELQEHEDEERALLKYLKKKYEN